MRSISATSTRQGTLGYNPSYGAVPQTRTYRPMVGQQQQSPLPATGSILDSRWLSFITNTGAAVIGGIAGWKFEGHLSTAAWVLSIVGALRAFNDLGKMGQ